MVRKRILDPAPVLEEAVLLQSLRDAGIKEVHAKAVFGYALSEGMRKGYSAGFEGFEGSPYHAYTPAHLTPLLHSKFEVLTSEVVEVKRSEDGTIKLLVRLQDGKMVESVIISHAGVGGTHPRTTLCVSSQVGCQMACTFCATGTMGLVGDLWAGEILEQVLHASRLASIRNIVFMGMGEPLNNYDAVLAAIRGMSDSRLFGLSPRHITLSTVGVVPRMRQLTRDAPETQLALSLHAPNQALRNQIVPSARAYRLDKLMEALDGHLQGATQPTKALAGAEYKLGKGTGGEGGCVEVDDGSSEHMEIESGAAGEGRKSQRALGRRALIEYVMLAGVNDSEENGRELGALLEGKNVLVNLIPYNPTAAGSEDFKEPTEEVLQSFRNVVAGFGLLVTIRRHHGRDIDGACGQLALKTTQDCVGGGSGRSTGSKGGSPVGDIEDVVPEGGRGSTRPRWSAKTGGAVTGAGSGARGNGRCLQRGLMAAGKRPHEVVENGGVLEERELSKRLPSLGRSRLAVTAAVALGLGLVGVLMLTRTQMRVGGRGS